MLKLAAEPKRTRVVAEPAGELFPCRGVRTCEFVDENKREERRLLERGDLGGALWSDARGAE